MDKTLALHLSKSHNQTRGQREPFSLFKEPCFTHERDIAGSTATKVYKADPQCRALLQGSLKELLTASGDAPTPQQMAEMRRLTQEIISLNKHSTEWTGRVLGLHESAR